MKLTCNRSELVAKLSVVARAVSTRAATQSLAGILLTVEGSGATLRSTDMELGLQSGLEVTEVEGSGTVLLPGRLLSEVARSLSADTVELQTREEQRDVEIRSGASSFHLRTLPAEDFPPFPQADGDPLRIPAAELQGAIDIVARAASRDDMRPVLTGVLVTLAEGSLTMVATDSYRLSVKETRLDAALEGGFEANVPARALQELTRIVQHGSADQLAVSVRSNQVVFEAAGVVLSSRLIDGQFPNYRQLLPDAYEHELQLSGTEITEVVRRISLLAQKNAPLRLSFSEGELTVSARTPDVGEAQETVPVPFAGEPLEIGFNPEFLRDGLEALEGGDVLLKLISPLRPGLIQAADGSGFQYLLMPIRLNV